MGTTSILTEHAITLLDAIDGALSGALDPEVAVEAAGFPGNYKHRSLAAAWHALSHFADDSDIRTADEDYDRRQRQGLAELASGIRHEFGLGS